MEGLAPWALKIARWRTEGRDVYAYFNNDVHGYAVEDAARLVELAGGPAEARGAPAPE